MADISVLASKAVESGGKLLVRSALNPILWLCGIVSVPAIGAAVVLVEAPNWLIALAFLPVCAAIFGFLVLLFLDRDKLQSEEYQIKKRSLELMEQKGDLGPILIPADTVEAIPKPEILSISGDVESENG